MMGFTTKQVAAFTGLTVRQLNYFDTTGSLSPVDRNQLAVSLLKQPSHSAS